MNNIFQRNYRSYLLACSLLLTGSLAAQANLTGWHRDGQTWLVWDDNLSFAGVESVSIYRSQSPINSLVDLQASEAARRCLPNRCKRTAPA